MAEAPTANERELKLALDDPSLLPRLLEALPRPERVVEQRNRYFADPDGVTRREKLLVRVREERPAGALEPSRVVLAVKRRTKVFEGFFESEEREEDVPLAVWSRVRSGEANLMDLTSPLVSWLGRTYRLRSLDEHASMVNVRHVVRLAPFVLEVDETTFPDGSVDAEVEVETRDPEGARAVVLEVAASAGVSLVPQTKGKYARLRARLGL
jgi:hypothetical protein